MKKSKAPGAKTPAKDEKTTIKTPSEFGSHASMVVQTSPAHLLAQCGPDEVVCQDNHGFYITKKSRLDNGLADPNRYRS